LLSEDADSEEAGHEQDVSGDAEYEEREELERLLAHGKADVPKHHLPNEMAAWNHAES